MTALNTVCLFVVPTIHHRLPIWEGVWSVSPAPTCTLYPEFLQHTSPTSSTTEDSAPNPPFPHYLRSCMVALARSDRHPLLSRRGLGFLFSSNISISQILFESSTRNIHEPPNYAAGPTGVCPHFPSACVPLSISSD